MSAQNSEKAVAVLKGIYHEEAQHVAHDISVRLSEIQVLDTCGALYH